MGSPHGIAKSTGRDYAAADKLAVVEHTIVQQKKLFRKLREQKSHDIPAIAERLDILRAIARDYRKTTTINEER